MRQFFVFLLVVGASFPLFSQDISVNRLRNETSRDIKKDLDTAKWKWKSGGVFSANLGQGSLSNWAAGGDNFSVNLALFINYFWFMKSGKHNWDNKLDFNFGYIQTTSLGARKNDDRVDYLSKYGYEIDKKWFLTGLFNLRTQFFDGYTFPKGEPQFTSTLFSPAFVLLSVGLDYKPNTKFSMFMSPLTSRWVIVANKELASKGLYGVPPGKMAFNEAGAFVTVNYTEKFANNITYRSRLDLFSNYKNNPENIDLFMTNVLSFKINKYLSATYNLDLIYDDDLRIFGENKTSAALQVKSILGIGFLYQVPVKRK